METEDMCIRGMFPHSGHRRRPEQHIPCTVVSVWQNAVNYIERLKMYLQLEYSRKKTGFKLASAPQLLRPPEFVDQGAKKYKCILKEHS